MRARQASSTTAVRTALGAIEPRHGTIVAVVGPLQRDDAHLAAGAVPSVVAQVLEALPKPRPLTGRRAGKGHHRHRWQLAAPPRRVDAVRSFDVRELGKLG